MVAMEGGGYFFRELRDRPGKGGKKFFCSAIVRVDRAGEKRAAWAKATMSAGRALLFTAFRAMFLGGSFMRHKPRLVESRVPVRII